MNTFSETESLETIELNHLFLSFCSYVTLTQGKRLNIANIFLLVLQNRNLRELFKTFMELETDYLVVETFLKFDNSLYKSKYITKYLNAAGKNKIR
jgi:hypothetical protein